MDERERRDDERESESESESRSRGRLSEGSDDLGFRLRRFLIDLGLGLGFLNSSAFEFCCFLSPRSSRQRLEHFGALGEEIDPSDAAAISDLIVDLIGSGDLISGCARDDVSWRGTSIPSEKSSSAVSIATGSWRLNSKSIRSLAGPSPDDEGSDIGFGFGFGFGLPSRLKEARGLKRLREEGIAGELFTQAEAIGEH